MNRSVELLRDEVIQLRREKAALQLEVAVRDERIAGLTLFAKIEAEVADLKARVKALEEENTLLSLFGRG